MHFMNSLQLFLPYRRKIDLADHKSLLFIFITNTGVALLYLLSNHNNREEYVAALISEEVHLLE